MKNNKNVGEPAAGETFERWTTCGAHDHQQEIT